MASKNLKQNKSFINCDFGVENKTVFTAKGLLIEISEFKIFQKNKVVAAKTPFFLIGSFCSHHFICLNIGFWYESFAWNLSKELICFTRLSYLPHYFT